MNLQKTHKCIKASILTIVTILIDLWCYIFSILANAKKCIYSIHSPLSFNMNYILKNITYWLNYFDKYSKTIFNSNLSFSIICISKSYIPSKFTSPYNMQQIADPFIKITFTKYKYKPMLRNVTWKRVK